MVGHPLTENDHPLDFRLHKPQTKLDAFLTFFGRPAARVAESLFPARNVPLAAG